MVKPTVDLGYPTPATGKIPSFNSIEEEAEFWDTHDVTDYLDELEVVATPAKSGLPHRLTLRLEQADRIELDHLARSIGVGPSTLARIWIKERLSEEKKARKAS